MSLIEVSHLSKFFDSDAGRVVALNDISFEFTAGEFVGIVGKSGSGKTTLINMLTGIDHPSEGTIVINGEHLEKMSENDLSIFRGKNIGIVFQFFQLLPVMTVMENILLPMDYLNQEPLGARSDRANEILAELALVPYADKYPHELSGGLQQIAAIARALANDPPIIIADEPTGNLDSVTAAKVVDLFQRLVQKGKTILMVTHDRDMVQRTSKLLRIRDGHLSDNQAGKAETQAAVPNLPIPIEKKRRFSLMNTKRQGS